MQRIEVTGEGITLTLVTEPLISMYGKEMRPGDTGVYPLAWDEISGVSLSAIELPPDGDRWITLTVDITWGEFFEVDEGAEGFTDAVRELCRLSGLPAPDMTAPTMSGHVIWRPSMLQRLPGATAAVVSCMNTGPLPTGACPGGSAADCWAACPCAQTA